MHRRKKPGFKNGTHKNNGVTVLVINLMSTQQLNIKKKGAG
jgi:hypothetical protein